MFYIHYVVLPEKTVKVLRAGSSWIEAGTANSAVRSLAESLRTELKVPRGRVRITSIDVMERLDPRALGLAKYRVVSSLDPKVECADIAGVIAG
jgi:hypothetical protein